MIEPDDEDLPNFTLSAFTDEFARCKNCHYSLSNLHEPRCPECGQSFDPNDRTTYEIIWVENFKRFKTRPRFTSALIIFFAVIVAAELVYASDESWTEAVRVLPLVLLVATVAVGVLWVPRYLIWLCRDRSP